MAATTQFRDVHAKVLRQHAEIRARLHGLDACAAPARSEVASAYLRVSLLRLAALFEAHLLYEEVELAPRIRDVDAWGPVREAALLAEHVEQRTRVQRVCAMAEEDSCDVLAFAREVSSLVVSFMEDMAREENELAELARIDEFGVEQMTG